MPEETLVLTELTLNALGRDGQIDEKDFLDRVDILCSLGLTVMISTFQEFYKLVHFLNDVTKIKKVGIILGVTTLQKLFESKYYSELKGNILEAFGILFGRDVKMYVYPTHKPDSEELLTLENFELPESQRSLFRYLMDNHKLEDIHGFNRSIMHIQSDKVLAMIKTAEPGWEEMVPENVENIVKDNCLFDYPCSIEELQRAAEKDKARPKS